MQGKLAPGGHLACIRSFTVNSW